MRNSPGQAERRSSTVDCWVLVVNWLMAFTVLQDASARANLSGSSRFVDPSNGFGHAWWQQFIGMYNDAMADNYRDW